MTSQSENHPDPKCPSNSGDTSASNDGDPIHKISSNSVAPHQATQISCSSFAIPPSTTSDSGTTNTSTSLASHPSRRPSETRSKGPNTRPKKNKPINAHVVTVLNWQKQLHADWLCHMTVENRNDIVGTIWCSVCRQYASDKTAICGGYKICKKRINSVS